MFCIFKNFYSIALLYDLVQNFDPLRIILSGYNMKTIVEIVLTSRFGQYLLLRVKVSHENKNCREKMFLKCHNIYDVC